MAKKTTVIGSGFGGLAAALRLKAKGHKTGKSILEEDKIDLAKLLFIEDEVIYKWYFEKNLDNLIPKTKVSTMLKNFKL